MVRMRSAVQFCSRAPEILALVYQRKRLFFWAFPGSREEARKRSGTVLMKTPPAKIRFLADKADIWARLIEPPQGQCWPCNAAGRKNSFATGDSDSETRSVIEGDIPPERLNAPVSDCKNSAKNFCRIVREKTWFFANGPGYAAANPLRIL